MPDLTYIVFLGRSDEERGFALLMQRTPVHAYPHGVYGIDPAAAPLLTEAAIGYRQATEEEVSGNVPGRPVRNPAAAHV
jgi:hypothetical protein